MKVRLKQNLLIVTAETEEEKASLTSWAASFDNHVFALKLQDEQTFRLTSLGPRPMLAGSRLTSRRARRTLKFN